MSDNAGTKPTPGTGGIEGQLDAGLAESDRLGDEADTDLSPGSSDRPDPDDPKAAMKQSVEKSHGED